MKNWSLAAMPAATYPPNVQYADTFRKLERQARERKQGLWSAPTVPSRYAEDVSNQASGPMGPMSRRTLAAHLAAAAANAART
jgi:nuclease-like protein